MNGQDYSYDMNTHSIMLPIEARSIFRVLDSRRVVESEQLAKVIGNEKTFNDILAAIHISDRITHINDKPDFLNYDMCHNGSKEVYDDINEKIKRMSEQQMCKSRQVFFNKKFNVLNLDPPSVLITDYQVPLSFSSDSGEGVIDMIGISDPESPTSDKTIYIIEAKKWESDEHPLRAMFESVTFWKLLQDDTETEQNLRFKKFIDRYNSSSKRNIALPESSIAIPVILVRKKSKIYNKMISEHDKDYTDCHESYKQLYTNIINTGLRCWCYERASEEEFKLTIEDFTDSFRDHWGIKEQTTVAHATLSD